MSTRRLWDPSLSVVQIEERPPLGVQSRGIAVLRKRTKLDKRGLNEELLFAWASRRGALQGVCAHTLGVGWSGRSETPITVSLPSPTVIDYANTLACSPSKSLL